MRHLTYFFLLAFVVLSAQQLSATHIVGGEIFYERLTGQNYRITLVVYRDCYKGIPFFDDPAFVGVFDKNGNRIMNIPMTALTVASIPLTINDSCSELNKNLCYEIGTYTIVETLPELDGGYLLAYERCCWNSSVINIIEPLTAGITVTTTIPDSAVADTNNSAYFNNRTPPFLCLGIPLDFDHSATDPDGDSLTYELFTPFNAKKGISGDGIPAPPPYNELIYNPPYNLNNVMGGDALKIDAITGRLEALPAVVGQFVFGVRVNEYRNGELIGSTNRSYQFNVQACQQVTVAQFTHPIVQCGDSLVSFDNKSYGSSNFHWDFGDTASVDSISSSPQPTHIFSRVGTYQVRLIAYSDKSPLCNDTTEGEVSVYENLEAAFDWEDEKCFNFTQFYDRSNAPVGTVSSWKWNFGDGGGSNKENPYHEYELGETPSSFVVSLAVENQYGCRDSTTMIYTGVDRSYEIIRTGASKHLLYPKNDSALIYVEAPGAVKYEWTPETGLSSPNAANTYAHPAENQQYKVQVTDSRGCEAESYVALEVLEYLCGEAVTFVPNAFSPNADGENDYLRVRGEELNAIRFSVYNRWGELVFESENLGMLTIPSLGWDGRYHGELQDPGVFVYYLKARCNDNREFIKKGNVTLLK